MRVQTWLAGVGAALLGICGGAPAYGGEAAVARALRTDGPLFFVGELVPLYATPNPAYPPLDALRQHEFTLGRTVDGYVAPRKGVQTIEFRLSQLVEAPTQRFYGSAIRHINEQIVAWLNRHGLHGVRVRPDPRDIEPGTNRDLRPRDEDRLRLVILTEGAEGQPEARPQSFRMHATDADGPAYLIDDLIPEYAERHPDHPSLLGLRRARFVLGRTADGYVAPRPGAQRIEFRLDQLAAAPPQPIHASGLRALNQQIVAWLNEQGLRGVLVRPHEEDIDPSSGEDRRPEDRRELRVLIWTGRVKELRTFASGERVDPDERVDNPTHGFIKDHSPIKPGALRGEDLVRQDELDEYAARLNRHPGRRVDVALSPGREPGAVYLDYLITEAKPWTVYLGWSDTGTRQTTEGRQRIGFTHTQLTNRDDILRLDYVTGGFDELNAFDGSYDTPLFGWSRLRARLHGGFSDFDASVFGFPALSFEGERWQVGGDLVANVLQRGELFLDLFAGLRYEEIEVDNPFALAPAEESFLLPRVGAVIERKTDTSHLYLTTHLEMNDSGLSGNDGEDLEGTAGLGRLRPDEDWTVFRWDASWRGYLEPLLDRAAWLDPSSPESSTLAHEVALLFRGQYAFDNRLIPQEQSIAGGFYTVRGYPQAIVAADTIYLGSAEYRFHLPRVLPIRDQALRLPLLGDFRVTPQRVYGLPDWDLILRLFVDGARVELSDPQFLEESQTLLSAGFGAELQLWRNIVARVDLGFALRDLDRRGVESGDSETHVSIMTLY
ncbi:MAG: hypothetical protein ACE5FG_06900 [Myxococcota bacterium]